MPPAMGDLAVDHEMPRCEGKLPTLLSRLPPIPKTPGESSALAVASTAIPTTAKQKTARRHQLLQPVLVSNVDRWLTPRGAPPRRLGRPGAPADSGFVLAAACPTAAAEAASRDANATTKRPLPLCGLPQESLSQRRQCSTASSGVRQPPLPRVASRRRPRVRALKALTDGDRSSRTTSDFSFQRLKSPSRTDVHETLYSRDLLGRKIAFWRTGLDFDVNEHDAEQEAMADYRKECTRSAQHASRDQAAQYREAKSRQESLFELGWTLQHHGELSAPLCEDDRSCNTFAEVPAFALEEAAAVPLPPRSSPVDVQATKSRASVRRTKTFFRLRNSDHPDGENSDSDNDANTAEDGVPHGGHLKQSGLRPKQSLKVRLRRVRQNARAWLQNRQQAARDEGRSDSGNGSNKSDEDEEDDALDRCDRRRSAKSLQHVERSIIENRASQVAYFFQQSEQDQQAFHRIFELYDTNGSNTLDQAELKHCLADLGLRGRNQAERNAIRELLWSIDKLEVGLYEFATKIVPEVRARLRDLQHEKLLAQFQEADIDNSGRLSVEETVGTLRLMGTFPSQEQVLDAICDVVPNAAAIGKSIEGHWMMSRDILDMESFGGLIRLLQERTERERKERGRQIAGAYALTPEVIEAWEHSLVNMHEAFSIYQERSLPPSQVLTVVRECGLMPRNSNLSMLMLNVREEADESGFLDFIAFLRLASKLREQERQYLLKIFDKHDYNRSGGLTLIEIHHALAECGVKPRTHHEADELHALIDEFDEDCSGDVDREEFIKLCQFVADKLIRIQREVERQQSVKYGWTEKHFEELRQAFVSFDLDMSEFLEGDEVAKAIDLLQRAHSREDLNAVLLELGFDARQEPKSKVCFLDFLKIMKALEEREGQRILAKRLAFSDEMMVNLRKSFKGLQPREGLVLREKIKRTLPLHDAPPERVAEIHRELEGQPTNVGFEVYMRFMKKALDAVGHDRESYG